MTNPSNLFEQFLREKQYIKGVAAKTIKTYRDAWSAYRRFQGCTYEITETGLKTFVIVATQAGGSPGAVNSFARSLNSFLTRRR